MKQQKHYFFPYFYVKNSLNKIISFSLPFNSFKNKIYLKFYEKKIENNNFKTEYMVSKPRLKKKFNLIESKNLFIKEYFNNI